MEKLKYKLFFIVFLGALFFLGPFLSNGTMATPSFLGIPRSYYFILIVWASIIVASGWVIQRSKW